MRHRHGQNAAPASADASQMSNGPDDGLKQLAHIANGESVRLQRIDGGRGLQARLAAMGLIPGVTIKMVRNTNWGPCIVAVRDSRVMIGHGMADRVLVR